MTPTERTYGHPQVVIFSLTNWDSAFSTLQVFVHDVEVLLDHVEREYSASTEIIVRTGQYFCCRTDTSKLKRKYSRLRNKSFDRHVVDAFKRRFGATRKVSIWDVSAISENQPQAAREQAIVCPANHARSEVIETENQVLFNYMCGSK
ncbi:hypothetical protein EV175_005931 [Coemansia sp. RSA 1933]|nr:hypothetical protein EV175_005931 [Coemansia sp. RSA 1933]